MITHHSEDTTLTLYKVLDVFFIICFPNFFQTVMSSSKILDVLFCRIVDLKDFSLYFSESASQHRKYTPELARFCDIMMKPVNVDKNLSKTSSRDKGSGKMHCNKF